MAYLYLLLVRDGLWEKPWESWKSVPGDKPRTRSDESAMKPGVYIKSELKGRYQGQRGLIAETKTQMKHEPF